MTTAATRPLEVPTLQHQPSDHPNVVSLPGWIAAVGAFLVATFYLPTLSSGPFPPKAGVLLVLGALGLPALALRSLGRGTTTTVWSARAAVAFVIAGGVSTAVSRAPLLALGGTYTDLTGWLFMISIAGCWALGTMLGPRDRDALSWALILASMLNAVVALLQVTVGLGALGLPTYAGQPTGLLGNPTFLGALFAASLALMVPRFGRRPIVWSVPVAFMGVSIGLTGERLPALLALVVASLALGRALRRRRAGAPAMQQDQSEPTPATVWTPEPSTFATPAHDDAPGPASPAGWRRVLGSAHRLLLDFGAVIMATVAAGSLLASSLGTRGVLPATSSSTTSETFGQRFSAWSYGLQAIVHRPLFGFGPDQFRAATLPHYTTAFAANNGQSYFLDGHNIFVEYLVTIGIVGLAALVAWLVLAVSGRRGALLVFALVLLASELVEPLTVVIAPLAFLALGAAPVLREATSGGDRAVEQVPRWASVAGLALGGVALVAGATFTVGDVAYQRAIGLGNSRQYTAGAADAHTASTLLPLWPDPAETLSQLDAVNAAETAPGTGLRVPVAAHWAQVAVDRDPTNPANLLWLATMLSIDHRYRAAKTALQEGRQADPNYVPDLDLLAAYDLRDGDRRAADAILEESLKIDPRQGIVGGILSRRCGAALPGALPDSPFSLTCQLNP